MSRRRRPPRPPHKPLLVLLVADPGSEREAAAGRLAAEGHLVIQADSDGAVAYLVAVRSEPGAVTPPDRAVVLGGDGPDVAVRLSAAWPMPIAVVTPAARRS
jgi:hypothetical protein